MSPVRALVPLFPLLVGCAHGGSYSEPASPPPPTPNSSSATDAVVEPEKEATDQERAIAAVEPEGPNPPTPPMEMPTECALGSEPCVPPLPFVKGLCQGKYPSVALVMFEKSSPWTRIYIRQETVDAVNTQGGPSSDQDLVFGEELLLLRDTAADASGIQVSGGGYFVLRWDGTCATVAPHEVVDYAPGMLKNAPVVWKYLDAPLRDALLKKPNIKNAHSLERAECRGARPGQGTPTCQRARRLLNTHLTLAVRGGMNLPDPERLP
jgi:hypothetical protein